MSAPRLDVPSFSVECGRDASRHCGERLAERVCDRLAVMHLGKTLGLGYTYPLFSNPTHPETRALLSAIPVLHPHAGRRRITLDAASFDRDTPLGEAERGNWAAA